MCVFNTFFHIAVCMATTLAAFAQDKPSTNDLANPQAAAVECRPRNGLPNFYSKLRQNGDMRIAYLGGSITAQDGWRPQTLAWFQKQFPKAHISEINAAIGGTGSDLGVYRLRHDVLDHHPDLLFVEFAVNDGGADPADIYRQMEGIIRQTWKSDPSIDICFVYTLVKDYLKPLQEGHFPRAASAMEKVADHYAIPSIHMGVEVARLEKEGKLVFTGAKPQTDAEKAALKGKILFSPDSVHPYTDTGHAIYLQAIIRSMAQIENLGKPAPHVLGAPLVPNNLEAAQMLPLDRARLSAGWVKLDPATNHLARDFAHYLSPMWTASKPGETLTIKFRGATLAIYDLLGPDCGQVSVQIDDQPSRVQPRFDAFCIYHRLAKWAVADHLSNTVHTVKFTIQAEQPDKVKILAQRNEKMDDPKRFDGTAWYAGAILVVGELLPVE
jgi:hypothetical protein